MIELTSSWLFIWGVIGLLILMYVPAPKKRWQGFVQLTFGGPIVWVGFIMLSFKMWFKGEI